MRIDAKTFLSMLKSGANALDNNKEKINNMNVFPVPDGDTGTNMGLTISTAAIELKKKVPETVGAAASVTASALLRGARGNSGVILSLLFRGFAKSLKEKETADGAAVAAALTEGVGNAYKAVMKPADVTLKIISFIPDLMLAVIL